MQHARDLLLVAASACLLAVAGAASAQVPTYDPPLDDPTYIVFECRDGIDNDRDGRVDFPDDPGCADADDEAERRPTPVPRSRSLFRPMPVPSGSEGEPIQVYDLSRDGRVKVGTLYRCIGNDCPEGTASVVWHGRRLHLIEDLRPLVTPDFRGETLAYGVSDDGRLVVGRHATGDAPEHQRAWLWQSREQLVELESPPSPYGSTFRLVGRRVERWRRRGQLEPAGRPLGRAGRHAARDG